MNRRGAVANIAVAAFLFFASVLGVASGQEIEEVVALENDSVRVALLTFPPGSASGEHVNPGPEMGIILEGELTLITPEGREVLGPGAARWLPPYTTHDARNEGTAPVKLWALLLKRCN
jgi:quercetin dioxygenase-like cupin family protein